MARLSCLLVTLAVCFLFSNVHARPMTHFHFYGKIECPKDVMRYQIYARDNDWSIDELGKTPYRVARKPYSYDLKVSTDSSEAGAFYEVALVISHNCTDDGSNKYYGFLPPTPDGPGRFDKFKDHVLKVNFPNILNAEHEITKNDW
ncbi:hypothetical protein CRE_21176 [Caenorhabditis remanei]|uniref:Uncharacterized protein n=1 Tax=Caenorhabditis remanei TaxID=31234 RepID=E3MF58_CAERE|nr:hypothetical protein CRE_21176 [Caenorhabditis remanei]